MAAMTSTFLTDVPAAPSSPEPNAPQRAETATPDGAAAAEASGVLTFQAWQRTRMQEKGARPGDDADIEAMQQHFYPDAMSPLERAKKRFAEKKLAAIAEEQQRMREAELRKEQEERERDERRKGPVSDLFVSAPVRIDSGSYSLSLSRRAPAAHVSTVLRAGLSFKAKRAAATASGQAAQRAQRPPLPGIGRAHHA